MTNGITRREAIRATAGAAAGAVAWAGAGVTDARGQSMSNASRKRMLRFAHLTDIHVKPEKGAAKGMAAALRHAQSLEDPPEMIFTGGDWHTSLYTAIAVLIITCPKLPEAQRREYDVMVA